ncbi:MAG: hypothetical protein JW795_23785 [Chitinivibrionales bacterium]|nr:hypothetical protein [Chitinivibrionales bacterium]
MSKKVLIATEKPFAKDAVEKMLAVFKKAGYETVLLEKYKEKADLLKAAAAADGLIVRSDEVDGAVLAAAPNLKIVVRAGAGYDNIDCVKAKEKKIVVMNTPGQNSNAVAELAFGLMLNLARRHYSGKDGTELRGKTIGILGYGNVGRYIGKIANGFGMKVFAYDVILTPGVTLDDGTKILTSVEELFSTCDYVSLNIPATEKTKNSINFNLLSKMKKNAVVINTARKEVVHEADLVKFMESRPDFYYGSDIAPDCKDLLKQKFADRVFFTEKKLGAQTAEANANAGVAAAQQIVNFFEKNDVTFQVNK